MRYAEKAVEALADFYAANLPTQMRAVETENGLDPNTLLDPIAYVSAFTPWDNRSPLVQIFDVDGQFEDRRNDLSTVNCNVGLTFNGITDLGADEQYMRRMLTALILTIRSDPTLGGRVVGAILTGFGRSLAMTNDSATRHERVLEVTVHVHDP